MTRMLDKLIREYREIYTKLYKEKFIIDNNEFKIDKTSKNLFNLTWSGKNAHSNITFDEQKSAFEIHNNLLNDRQYSLLFYDKSILQVEYIIDKRKILKQRMLYIKKNNIVLSIEDYNKKQNEIDSSNPSYTDLLEEENSVGIPIFLRVDYDPDNYCDRIHAKTHFVFSNLRDCRIPMKSNVTLSQFLEFIIQQVYNEYSINFNIIINHEEDISISEKNDLHFNWSL